MTRQHWLVDRLFSAIPGVAHTIVKPGFFAEDYFRDDWSFRTSRHLSLDVRQ